jgi:hypothetical protein
MFSGSYFPPPVRAVEISSATRCLVVPPLRANQDDELAALGDVRARAFREGPEDLGRVVAEGHGPALTRRETLNDGCFKGEHLVEVSHVGPVVVKISCEAEGLG